MTLTNPFKKPRNIFYIYVFLDNTIFNISNCGGLVLTSLFLFLNLKESEITVLMSITGLATFFQIFSTLIYQRTANKKKVMLSFLGIKSLALLALGFIPLITKTTMYFPLTFLFLSISFSFQHLIGGGIAEWNDSHVPENMKGKYYGRRNAITNVGFILVTFFVGKILDHVTPSPLLYICFFLTTTILYLIELFLLIKIPIIKKPAKEILSLKDVFIMPLQNKPYRSFIGFSILWTFAASFGKPLVNVYAIKHMNFSYSFIAITASITAFIKIFSGIYFGHLIDHKGVNYVVKLSGIGFAVFTLSYIFIRPNAPYLFFMSVLGLGIFMIAFNVSKFRLNLKLADAEHMNTFLSANGFFIGISTFLSLYISSHIIEALTGVTLTILGISINSYQLLFLISGTLHFLAIYYFIKILNRSERNNCNDEI